MEKQLKTYESEKMALKVDVIALPTRFPFVWIIISTLKVYEYCISPIQLPLFLEPRKCNIPYMP